MKKKANQLSLCPILRVLMLVLPLLMIRVYSQGSTATVLGVVKDTTGAVLPGVSITVKNTETGITRSAISDDGGRFRVPQLAVGSYEVQSELMGFQTTTRRGITLSVGQEAVIDVTMNVGEMTEHVEVVGEAPQVETTSSTISGLVDEKKVRDLPLNARSLIELAPLKTGIVFSETGGQNAAVSGFSKKISISGSRSNTSLFQVDGSSITDRTGAPGSAAGLLMGVETIREFSIVTNAYSAEYGKHTGGVFNAVTKSGTNELHGSIFEFLRNDNFDARNFFDRDPRNPLTRSNPPEFKRNQFGFALGGPIDKNKSFVFGSWESLRERLGVTQNFTVPNNDARNGLVPVAGGQLRNVGVAANVKPFLDWWPLANGQDLGGGRADFIRGASQDIDEDFVTVRLDHNFSESDSLFGRYTYDDAIRQSPSGLNVFSVADTRNQFLTIGETKIVSPQLINKFIFGFNRSNLSQYNSDFPGSVALRSFSIYTQVGGRPLYGSFSVGGGFTSPGGSNFTSAREVNNYFQWKDDLYYTRGRNSYKFGVDIERRQDNRTQGVFQRGGQYAFTSIESFLLGTPSSFNTVISGNAERYLRQTQVGFYFQDDVKWTSRLTVNLGVRYDFVTDLIDRYGQVSTFRFDWRPVLGLTAADASVGNPLWKNPPKTGVAPRIGFAWDPWGDTKASLRAGFGLFWDQLNSKYSAGGDSSIEPLINRRGNLLAGQNITVPIDFPNAATTQAALLRATPQADATFWEPNTPYVLKWSLDIQREITPGTVVDVGYTGTRSVHLSTITNWNPPIAQIVNGRLFVASNAPLRHPNFGRLRPMQFNAGSSYHAFRLELNRRFARALQFQASYTFSKSIDDFSGTVGSGDYTNESAGQRYLDMRDTGLSAFDVRQNLVFNFTYDLPGKSMTGVSGKLLGGWSLSSIGRFSSGPPFGASSGVLPAYMVFIRDYPDLRPGVDKVAIDSRNPDRYFDPSAFLIPPTGFIGNFGRNVLVAPGVVNFDLVLTNDIKATERVNVEFRAELFNLFNRANFGLPSGAVFDRQTLQPSGNVGRITSTTGTSRQIQFGLKILF